jgi:beta-glucuronidase
MTAAAHARDIRELISRDKNHPSVVMWSIANEPASSEEGSRQYFEPLATLTRELDSSRPVAFANQGWATPETDQITDLFDVVCLNRYFGWYETIGDLKLAEIDLETELQGWEDKYNKPIIMTEYGADTIAGLHTVQSLPWSEEFQVDILEMYHRVFDRIESMAGEHVWNFADFQTKLGTGRVDGNKKGVFERDRRPKAAAHSLRRRWTNRDQRGFAIQT